MTNLEKIQRISRMTHEQLTRYMDENLKKLTPEEKAANKQLADRTVDALIQGIHEENQELNNPQK